MSAPPPPPPPAKISFSFGPKKTAGPTSTAASSSKPKPPPPAAPRPSAFSLADDDDPPPPPPPEASSSRSWGKPKINPKTLVHQAVAPSRSVRTKQEAALEVDQTAFKYDEVWDDMKEAEKRARKSKEEAEEGRAPKYMAQAIASAATRKLDRIRAEEKMLEKERELEGEEFADKDKFVTQAYKDQMAEVRRAEEEEKATEAKLRASSVGGISSFYKSFLEKDAEAHSAAVSATLAASKPPDPTNLTIVKPKGPVQGPTLPPPTSDAALAADAKAKGLNVETNDSGEIVDSRDLLTPGLNFMPKKQPPPSVPGAGGSGSGGASGSGGVGAGVSRRVGAAAGGREIRERQERMMAAQLEEEEKRLEREREEREQKRIVGVKEKRNDEVAVGSARERFLERKRAKLEEEEREKKEAAAAAAAGGSAP
ncbi:coiled-coil domain-containing protein 55-domain containing protein [Mrakia frigida]|uniref:nuclear speckle splicing regulatory family 1 protein n=1 Tax=Mrakia frigida TaxID=29902 RepID=UPI003FCBF60C